MGSRLDAAAPSSVMDTPIEPMGTPLPAVSWPKSAIKLAMSRDPLRLFEYGHRRHGDVVLYRSGPLRYVVLADPVDAEHVLLKRYRAYEKRARHPVLQRVMGEGVIMTNGDRWRRQRKALAPAFQPRQLERLVAAMASTADEVVGRWRDRDGERVEVYAELSVLTRKVVGGALFGTSGDDVEGCLGEALDVLVERCNVRANRPWHLPYRYRGPRNRRFHRAADDVDAFVYDLVAQRRLAAKDDVLSMLMVAHEQSGLEPMDDRELRDEILNLFLAGFETTAAALTWTVLLLRKYPAVARRVAEEVAAVVGRGPIEYEHLLRLEYTGWVLNEAMRMYPPIWTNERVAIEPDTIAGHHIPEGTMVAVSTWLLHHNPKVWRRPELFLPERFSPEQSEGRHRCAFVPFGFGPRICVGNHFAALHSKLAIAALVRGVAMDVERLDPRPMAAITLRPAEALPAVLRAR